MKRRTRYVVAVGLLLALTVIVWRVFLWGSHGAASLSRALAERGRVAVVASHDLRSVQAQGTVLVAAEDVSLLTQALAGRDGLAVARVLEKARLSGLLIEPQTEVRDVQSVAARLARYEHVTGLRGLFMDPAAVLYAADPIANLSQSQREATGVVARALVGGARPPKLSSFPAALRAIQPVEIMVLLRRGGRPRLWRSARGNSIATALLTAAAVARQRWQEREQAMGGNIDAILPSMDVEVSLLGDDGTIGEAVPAFIDRVFFPEHGVAYERRGAWRYLLPEATLDAGKGRASRAYRALFKDDGLPEDSFTRNELRLYRLIVQTIAISKAPPPPPDDGLSPVKDPDEVLGTKQKRADG